MLVNKLERIEELLASDTSKFYDNLGTLVNMRLIELGWSTQDLADAMNRSVRTVRRIRNGEVGRKMRVGTFFRLLHALNYDLPLENLEIESDHEHDYEQDDRHDYI